MSKCLKYIEPFGNFNGFGSKSNQVQNEHLKSFHISESHFFRKVTLKNNSHKYLSKCFSIECKDYNDKISSVLETF